MRKYDINYNVQLSSTNMRGNFDWAVLLLVEAVHVDNAVIPPHDNLVHAIGIQIERCNGRHA